MVPILLHMRPGWHVNESYLIVGVNEVKERRKMYPLKGWAT